MPATPTSVAATKGRLVDTLLGAARLQVGVDPILSSLTESWLRDLVALSGPGGRAPETLKADGHRLFQDGEASDALVDRIRGAGLRPGAFLLISPRPGTTIVKTRPGAGRDGATVASFSLHRTAADEASDTAFARLAVEIAHAGTAGPGTATNGDAPSALDGLIAVHRQGVVRLDGPPPAERVAAALIAVADRAGLPQFADRLDPIGAEIARLLRDAAGVADLAGMLALPPAGAIPGVPARTAPDGDRQLRRLVAAARAVAVQAGAARKTGPRTFIGGA